MPKIALSKESLKGLPQLPVGIVEFRLDGFKPTLSKQGDSVNLNPTMRIINHPDLVNRQIFENLNSKFGRGIEDFVHSLGLELVDNGGDSVDLPGSFGPDNEPNPAKWPPYNGPMLGRTGKVELMETDNNRGGKRVVVKRYFCQVANCQTRHAESLQKAA